MLRHTKSSNLGSGTISPRFVVLHYTTGWSATGSRNWLMGAAGGTSNSGSSAHVVIDVDGTAWQIVAFNRRVWHAGPSRCGATENLSAHSIGLELLNPGWLRKTGHDRWTDYFGNRRTDENLQDLGGYVLAPHQRIGSGDFAWPFFPAPQIERGLSIARAICAKYQIELSSRMEKSMPRAGRLIPVQLSGRIVRRFAVEPGGGSNSGMQGQRHAPTYPQRPFGRGRNHRSAQSVHSSFARKVNAQGRCLALGRSCRPARTKRRDRMDQWYVSRLHIGKLDANAAPSRRLTRMPITVDADRICG